MKCKHENGWFIANPIKLFVDKNGNVKQHKILTFRNSGEISFSSKVRQKHVATCNNSNCSATRNVYVETKLIKMGRVKKRNI